MWLLINHLMLIIMIFLYFHLFNPIPSSLNFFIKQHIRISRLVIPTTTKALTLNDLLQIYLWHYSVVELEPLFTSLYIGVVMTSLCAAGVDEDATELVTVWVLYTLITAVVVVPFLTIITLLLDLHSPRCILLFSHKLLQRELSQIKIHWELQIVV